ncbi:hypothetical protein C8R47DRAFT_1294085 [Mycena vitilis]|nr:hypothetical protein C8R47DRAFT_1294085 [Mycena vitilis]
MNDDVGKAGQDKQLQSSRATSRPLLLSTSMVNPRFLRAVYLLGSFTFLVASSTFGNLAGGLHSPILRGSEQLSARPNRVNLCRAPTFSSTSLLTATPPSLRGVSAAISRHRPDHGLDQNLLSDRQEQYQQRSCEIAKDVQKFCPEQTLLRRATLFENLEWQARRGLRAGSALGSQHKGKARARQEGRQGLRKARKADASPRQFITSRSSQCQLWKEGKILYCRRSIALGARSKARARQDAGPERGGAEPRTPLVVFSRASSLLSRAQLKTGSKELQSLRQATRIRRVPAGSDG